MNNLIQLSTKELAKFLSAQLPVLSENWWNEHVVERLTFMQQSFVQDKGFKSLHELDFAALMRVFDKNWYELSKKLGLPYEGLTLVKEMQTVRNRWAHLSAQEMPDSEIYRDADTLCRLLEMIGAGQDTIDAIEVTKAKAVTAMADAGKSSLPETSTPPDAMGGEASQSAVVPASLFNKGDIVALRSNPDTLFAVIEVMPSGEECSYKVLQNNGIATYYESQLCAPQITSEERKILSIRELHAYLTSLQLLSPSTANLFSLRSGRVQFVPYQYRPVLKLIRADQPRLLIADEVGVGKTIEAGLIIKELQARMNLSSVLIICPKALVAEDKWFNEMKRFDEHFTALDGQRLQHCLKETNLEGEWPEKYSKAILPFSLFNSNLIHGKDGRSNKNNQGLLSLEHPPKFDLVIVDEAHHIRNPKTCLHQGVRYFCDNAQAVLLLTATPVQLGSKDLYTLLNVLRPDLIFDHASFEHMAEPNTHINAAVQHCRKALDNWQHDAHASLDEVTRTEWGRLFLRESPKFQQIYDQLEDNDLSDADRIEITHAIESFYTFSPLINRTRRRDIGKFTTRKPKTMSVEFTDGQKQLHDGVLDVIARILSYCHGQQNVKFMMTTIRRQAASCLYGLAPLLHGILNGRIDNIEFMEASDSDEDADLSFIDAIRNDIELLVKQARNLDTYDPKIEAFVKVLLDKNKMDNNKALVFSTFRHTLRYLADHTQNTGIRYGLIHGDVPDEERSELRKRFALPKGDEDALDVLLSSEVGCEGLDFQFCDLLINYDLPWNPMRIEQRIGRIDRYGQKSETVAIVNFITPGTVDADIYERCLCRIGVFQDAVGGNEEILGEITQELHDIAESFELSSKEREKRLQQLSDNKILRTHEEQRLESNDAELLGLNVPNASWEDEIEDAESFWLSPLALQTTVTTYLANRLKSESEHLLGGNKPLRTLRLNQEAKECLLKDYKHLPHSREPITRDWEKWLKDTQSTLTVTFDQEAAADNPKAVHLSVLHPLVRQAASFLKLDEPAYVALEVCNPELPHGEHHFALYRWRKQGIKQDDTLVAVASELSIESTLMEVLQSATETSHTTVPSATECDALDAKHYSKWTKARANHIAANVELVEHRSQSLTASHRARCKVVEDQIASATNDKIRLMKESELKNANADFTHWMREIENAKNSVDILAEPVVFGTIVVRGESI